MEPLVINVAQSTKIWAVFGETSPMGDPNSNDVVHEVQLFWELRRKVENPWETSLRSGSVAWYEVTKGTLEQVQVCHFFKYKKTKYEFFAVVFKEEEGKEYVFEIQATRLRPLKESDAVTAVGYDDHSEEPAYTAWYEDFFSSSSLPGGLFSLLRRVRESESNKKKNTTPAVVKPIKLEKPDPKRARERAPRSLPPVHSESEESPAEPQLLSDSSSESAEDLVPLNAKKPHREPPPKPPSSHKSQQYRQFKHDKHKKLKMEHKQALQTIADLRAEDAIRRVDRGTLAISPPELPTVTESGGHRRPLNRAPGLLSAINDIYDMAERRRADEVFKSEQETRRLQQQLERERAASERHNFMLRLSTQGFLYH